MNITANLLWNWAGKIESATDNLVRTRCHDKGEREQLDLVKKDLEKVHAEIMERYFDAVNDEAKPGVLPFQIISSPPGSQVKCPTKVVAAFVPDVPGPYILRAIGAR